MQATATSKRSKRIRPTKRLANATEPNKGPWDPNNVNKRCPATILAASRIANVAGRITFLTLSITTITGIKKAGVPVGTRWASKLLYW